jgi:hypothetical protein
MSCNWEALMVLRERRKRRIRERRENIFKSKKNINREEIQCKRGSSNYNSKREKYTKLYIFPYNYEYFDYGITNSIFGDK